MTEYIRYYFTQNVLKKKNTKFNQKKNNNKNLLQAHFTVKSIH